MIRSMRKFTGSKSKYSRVKLDIPVACLAPQRNRNSGGELGADEPASPVMPVNPGPLSPLDITDMRRYESTLNLQTCQNFTKCSCWILQPAPVFPNSPPRSDRVLVGGETEYDVRICKSADNIYRLVATRKESDEIFLNITLNHAKYMIKSDSWHEVLSTRSGLQRLVVLNFKNEDDKKRNSFERFYNELLDILHHQKHLSQVEVFYAPGYNYADTTPARGSQSIFDFEQHQTEVTSDMAGNITPTMSVTEMNKLLTELSKSLEGGDVEAAREMSATLARQRVKVQFDLKHPTLVDPTEPEISVKVYVEDKESSGACITMKVRMSETVGTLKKRVQKKYNFPEAVQKWVIGQRLPKDTEVLKACGITGPGCSMFLYLVSSRSVGLTREEFVRQKSLQVHGASGFSSQVTDDTNIYMSMDHMNRVTGGAASSPGGPSSRSMQGSGGSASPGQIPPHLQGPHQAPPIPVRPPPERSIPVGTLNPGASPTRPNGPPVGLVETGNIYRAMLNPPVPGNLNTAQPTTTVPSPGRPVQPSEESLQPDNQVGWQCPTCTYINTPTRPGCGMCAASRPEDYKVPDNFHIPDEEQERLMREQQLDQQAREAQQSQELAERSSSYRNYQRLIAADNKDVIGNVEEFTCPICFDMIAPGEGVILRECLHSFCRDCLASAILYTEEAELKCPFQDDEYSCPAMLQEREIRALVPADVYERYLLRSLTTAENQAANSYHCKTADCGGWCIYEDLLNFFDCPVCEKQNCLTCKAIHEGMNCKEYQEDLRIRANNDEAAKQTHTVIQKLLQDGEAMHCPQCQVIVQKKDGCDWIRCSICKLEICWVTKGPRWGPGGEGDTTGGCRCKLDGVNCHPSCVNCH